MDKPAIIQFIRARLKVLADTCKAEMQQAQADANSEEKSSAGDKYETARAMGQNQRDLHASRLETALLNLEAFESIAQNKPDGRAIPGSIIRAGGFRFYLGPGLGAIVLPDGEKLLCVSLETPLGQTLNGKSCGDTFLFSGQNKLLIEEIS
jgi:hypothetical protein